MKIRNYEKNKEKQKNAILENKKMRFIIFFI